MIRRLALLLSFSLFLLPRQLFAQQFNYDARWADVDKYYQSARPKSALQVLDTVYTQALKDNNDANWLKAMLLQVKFNADIDRENFGYGLELINKNIRLAQPPARAILYSMKGEMLWVYLRTNWYKISRRTNVVADTSRDVETWDLKRLHQEISMAYHTSLNEPEMLKARDIKRYADLLFNGVHTTTLRPTLFDLLSARALEYYITGGQNPAVVKLNDELVYATAAEFAAHHFTRADSSATLQYEALLLHQQVLAMKLASKDRNAILHADLARMIFVNQCVGVAGRELYKAALERMLNEYAGLDEVASVYYLLAAYHNGAVTPANRMATLDKVLAYCREAISKHPGTQGAVDCEQLLKSIADPSINIRTNEVSPPGKPFLSLVEYKNLDTVYFRVIKLDNVLNAKLSGRFSQYGNGHEPWWQLLIKQPAFRTWAQPLPNRHDYQQHSVEVKIDSLPAYRYVLLASGNREFIQDSNALSMQRFTVSRLSYFSDNGDFYVVDRETGQPLEGVQMSTPAKKLLHTTDKQGWIEYVERMDWNDYVLLHTAGDTLEVGYLSNYRRPAEKVTHTLRTWLFTDRAIYRPGQTVYFKGIVTEKYGNKPGSDKLKANSKTKLYLRDVNDDDVDSASVVTNEFGSFSGTFRIPLGGLTGEFTIEEEREMDEEEYDEDEGPLQHRISVEEYKRPKFSITYDTIRVNYRGGDTIRLGAKATALNGSVIDGAQVVFKVMKNSYRLYRGSSYAPSWAEEQVVASGATTTDITGSFTVVFATDTAGFPDRQSASSYVVKAIVTDRNGESREEMTTVEVGRTALDLRLTTVPQKTDSIVVQVSSYNRADYHLPTAVTLRASLLQPPVALKRDRLWQAPDQFIIPKEAFEKDFPYDEYYAKPEMKQWPKKEALWAQTITTSEKQMTVLTRNWPRGYYLFEATGVDVYGDTISKQQVVLLDDEKRPEFLYPQYLWHQRSASSAGFPGDKAAVTIGTFARDVYLLESVTRGAGEPVRKWASLSAQKKTSSFVLNEQDQAGGLHAEYVFVKNNRLYTFHHVINVGWRNITLDMQYQTFRNKLAPGEKETWQLKIKDAKGQKVAAEMLAAMYDASLDMLTPHSWRAPYVFYSNNSFYSQWSNNSFMSGNGLAKYIPVYGQRLLKPYIDERLNWFGWYNNGRADDYINIQRYGREQPAKEDNLDEVVVVGYGTQVKRSLAGSVSSVMAADMVSSLPPPAPKMEEAEKAPASRTPITIRKNFNETAFFLPQLRTDSKGSVIFSFTMPEALTKWRFMAMAHTKKLQVGYTEATVLTQKKLMVIPNAPRFLREGDKMDFTVKISSLADTALIGEAHLELLNAATMQPVDGWFQNLFPTQHFTVQPNQSTVVSFPIQIPFGYGEALVYRIVAEAGQHSDGEENALPVLSNKLLVTETMPLQVQGTEPRTFTMQKLLASDTMEGLQHHALTIEFTGNPVWNAIKSLPYLMEFPYECAEQSFNRFYANSIGVHIVSNTPGVKAVFDQWKGDSTALMSSLQLNEDLKSALLQETPWVMEAKNETEQRKRLATLFDLAKMESSQENIKQKLRSLQTADGSFGWFSNMPGNYYITQYIITGFGHLRALGVDEFKDDEPVVEMIRSALNYLDRQMSERYHEALKYGGSAHYGAVYQLYMRSFYKEWMIPADAREAYDYFIKYVKKDWKKYGTYCRGLIALALYREGEKATAMEIARSLKENAFETPEDGAYWKESWGYYWYQSPVETQALMIEVFNTITKDTTFVDHLKTWLLKNKQANSWSTTKATSEACYALLMGSNWFSEEQQVEIKAGREVIRSQDQPREAGTGYFRKRIEGKNVDAAMGQVNVQLQNSNGQPAWGAIYWQYFRDMDKITAAATPLQLEKELFIQQTTDKGTVLTKITEDHHLKVGDKVTVRIVLKVAKEMEFLHLKDLRAACFEPVNVLSGYRWRDGVGYYESTKDASTNFFFSEVRPGTYVFEYPVFVTHTGTYSNGIGTIQCMYAPEFSAHSNGFKVKVTE